VNALVGVANDDTIVPVGNGNNEFRRCPEAPMEDVQMRVTRRAEAGKLAEKHSGELA
jgi:hypothetical protein